jgi:predicted DCC family thiol-disulfide oxidoreductase YuxK
MKKKRPFTMLFDGGCPLCRREADFLRRLDRGRGRLELVDIAADNFDAGRFGRSLDELMAEIHGVLPDGRVVSGMEVFRQAYGAVGLGWILAMTRQPILSRITDAAYAWFARNRLRLTGRQQVCTTDGCPGTRDAAAQS